MRRMSLPFVDVLKPLALGLIGLILVIGLLGFRLHKMHAGVSERELPVVQTVAVNGLSAESIIKNPLYLPYKALAFGIDKLDLGNVVGALRATGALLGLSGLIAFYLILRNWHTRRIALLTTGLVATSSWFLHSSRIASPEASYLLLPWLVYAGVCLLKNSRPFKPILIGLAASVILLYVPGMVWFILPAIIWQWPRLSRSLREAGRWQTVLVSFLAVLALAPLAYSLITQGDLWQNWLGYTGGSIFDIIKNLARLPLNIIVLGRADPSMNVGRLPYLDVATTLFAIVGAYRYSKQWKLDRAKLVAGSLVIGGILTALNPMAAAVILPFIYLLVAAGLTFLLQQWFAVFPRNPLARNTGVALLCLLIGFVSFYHLRRYFVAWPATPATRDAYSHQVGI